MTVAASRGSAERRQAMVEYLKQMTDVVTAGSSEEERSAALQAIVTEIKGKEALIATDQRLSKVIERLVTANSSSDEIVAPVLSGLCDALLDIVYDQYGSHVVETVLKCVPNLEGNFAVSEQIERFTESVCSDIVGMMRDTRATYVLRSAVVRLGGFELEEGSDIFETISKYPTVTSTKFSDSVKKIIRAVSEIDPVELITLTSESSHSSLTLQVILSAGVSIDPELTSTIVTRFLQTRSGDLNADFLSLALDDKVGSKFLETLFSIARKMNIESIFDLFFEWANADLFEFKYSFGFMQFLVAENIGDPKQLVSRMFTATGMRLIAKKGGNHGIPLIQKMIERCVKIVECQKDMFTTLLAAIGVVEIAQYANIWSSILGVSVASFGEEQIDTELTKPTSAGCYIVSTLMGYKQSVIQPMISNATPFVELFKQLDFVNSCWLKEVSAGRCLQTVISLPSAIPTGIKKKIIKAILLNDKFPDQLGTIVLDRKVGAWLVTAAWDTCSGDVQTKQALGEALVAVEALRETNWKVWRYCGLATFSRRNEEWTHNETRKSKAQNVFKDIIGDSKKQKLN
jgi:hypothetical protein